MPRERTPAAPSAAAHLTGPVPDQALMGARDQLDRLGLLRIAGQRLVVGTIQADDLGQQMRIHGIRLRTRRGVSSPVPGYRQRVDREHLIPRPRPTRPPTAHDRSRSRPSPAPVPGPGLPLAPGPPGPPTPRADSPRSIRAAPRSRRGRPAPAA